MLVWLGMTAASVIGKRVSAKAAKVIGGVALVIAAIGLAILALALIRGDAVDDYKVEKQAETDRALLKAERQATAADEARDQEFANSQANISGSMSNAVQNDPNHGRGNAGPVTQSYFDSVRRERDRTARPE